MMPDNIGRQGCLIAFEGIDGTGKSTQIELLAAALSRAGQEVVTTREPTSGTYGQRIRELYGNRDSVSRRQELELFLADRREHIDTLIGPALARGSFVLTNRYFLSTAAYQGAAGFDPYEIMKTNEAFAPIPDLVVLIELPVSMAIDRIQSLRGETLNAFEQEESLRRVALVFQNIERDYIIRVDGSKNINDLHHSIMLHVKKLFSETTGARPLF